MDTLLKELSKLETLTTHNGSSQKPSVLQSVDATLEALRHAKEQLESGADLEPVLVALAQSVEERKQKVDDRQREIYNSLARFGKALDKKFSAALPTYENLFNSTEARESLERTISLHFLRTGQFPTAELFFTECNLDVSLEQRAQFQDLNRILTSLRSGDIGPALDWCSRNRNFLQTGSSPLEFYLHRSHYIRMLLSAHPHETLSALAYAKEFLRRFYPDYPFEFRRLFACMAYLPLSRLQGSPYSDLASPSLHHELESLFAKEFCSSLGMSRQVPLKILGDIGGGGALARIEKGRKLMRERKSEWSQTDELPIEIPLPPENRYHSIFACPVSKEQSTEQNPPMMMTCGHVITKDSLMKLSKPGGRVKCPYCPAESQVNEALRVYF